MDNDIIMEKVQHGQRETPRVITHVSGIGDIMTLGGCKQGSVERYGGTE